ncbi:hypothetical protein A5724_16935 [Mycobacterium sp. ACS1612]|uniref:hypothetical protein n=1 Tax=Mycobacterium sp. ACS1612 TaxID=1834117 RepID=UPI0007FE8EA7|nr:hypothetical protein [Mycobacterium sp. ACS1612]OBF34238.1 hypothetical protein A5724_16935 [Mycobacterium sp. ACS1612]
MWAEAAKWLAKFGETVVTGVDEDGYPVSVRVATSGYDSATGALPVHFPPELRILEGPANLLSHSHDDKMWHLQMIQIKGRIERRGERWVFQSTHFDAPSKLAFLQFLRSNNASAQKYLDKRGLKRPAVNWAAVKEIQRRVKSR